MADPIQSFLEQSNPDRIPQRRPVCCCGNEACAYLKHNQSALDVLEGDVQTAARLGKALLVRHESYIADSERERKAMTAHVGLLETEKQALEKKNATVIEENRSLLDQLEAVNAAVSESDAHVVNLQATLQSTQQEMQKLTQLASRTESLERQLADFEREQATWQSSFESKVESEKSANRRWQKAERTLANLQDEVERIEREAKDERERHHEIVERMERRHTVEKELGSAAGRLKNAAAAKGGSKGGSGPNVVSHFVKDILQDNANLQIGIVELREMLNNSNEEVESLRQRLQMHQPLEEEEEEEEKPAKPIPQRGDLRQELTRANSQELHVHHHYHAPPVPTPKAPPLRRAKKKRTGAFTPGHFTPPSRAGTPRSSFSYGSPTPTAAILQQTSASVPQPVPIRNRLSVQSNQSYQTLLASSGPSSPQSTTNRTSSIFDRVFSDAGLDSSRPTTPDTEDPGSPMFGPTHSKRGSQSSFRTHSAPVVTRGSLHPTAARPVLDAILSVEELPKLEQPAAEQDVIPEENEAGWERTSSPVAEVESNVTSPASEELSNPLHDPSFYRPKLLRRATSHESILSVSGIDVHTLRSRPSQLLAPYGGRGKTSQAVTADTTAHAARPAAMSRPTENSKNLLSGMAADQRQQGGSASKPLGQKVGGWIFGRWGATPEPSTAVESSPATARKTTAKATSISSAKATSISSAKAASISSASENGVAADAMSTPRQIKIRSPGINQSGPINGFFPEVKTPVRSPVLNSLDEEGLKNLLDGK